MAISTHNDASALHGDSNPPFWPFRMLEVPLPSDHDGALGGGYMPAAAPMRTRLTGIT